MRESISKLFGLLRPSSKNPPLEQMKYVSLGLVEVESTMHRVVEESLLKGSGVSPRAFWNSLGEVLTQFAPRNMEILRKRDALQALIDKWLIERRDQPLDHDAYFAFLKDIGYIVPYNEKPFKVVHSRPVDPEVCSIPGPQLVVPVDNLRYALNAANARWGNLMDAFYGTNAGPSESDGCEIGTSYNPKRGAKVFELTHEFLDTHFPLTDGAKYNDVVEFIVDDNAPGETQLSFKLRDGRLKRLQVDSLFEGHVPPIAKGSGPASVIFRHNSLGVQLIVDRKSAIGKLHPAGLSAVLLESAVTSICDFEDSVAAVDAKDKAHVYKNWGELMRGVAEERISQTQMRSLNPDKPYISRKKKNAILKGRSLLFVRNVGIHMYTDSVRLAKSGEPVPEGIVDLMVSALAARHDIFPTAKAKNLLNSAKGNMYLVKPKMHGPEEVAFVVELIERVEKELGLPKESIKLGIMDEERRTTVNLRECIRAAQRRCVFINTGFLDRTGDEIHTSFVYGPMMPKKEIESAPWRLAYENWNVYNGLEVDLPKYGQIGKGMWAAPDEMAEMMKKKGSHPKAGASTAWVPSPTAATLHAIHYHTHSVPDAQLRIKSEGFDVSQCLRHILTPPFLTRPLAPEEVQAELDNNLQGILGYVSRWVLLGVGCSKVPDINDIALMEDRATLRISSQHVANWLKHGMVTKDQLIVALRRMAGIVDRQNRKTTGFQPMGDSPDTSLPFQAALQLVLRGAEESCGLTERTLTEFRLKEKMGRSRL